MRPSTGGDIFVSLTHPTEANEPPHVPRVSEGVCDVPPCSTRSKRTKPKRHYGNITSDVYVGGVLKVFASSSSCSSSSDSGSSKSSSSSPPPSPGSSPSRKRARRAAKTGANADRLEKYVPESFAISQQAPEYDTLRDGTTLTNLSKHSKRSKKPADNYNLKTPSAVAHYDPDNVNRTEGVPADDGSKPLASTLKNKQLFRAKNDPSAEYNFATQGTSVPGYAPTEDDRVDTRPDEEVRKSAKRSASKPEAEYDYLPKEGGSNTGRGKPLYMSPTYDPMFGIPPETLRAGKLFGPGGM